MVPFTATDAAVPVKPAREETTVTRAGTMTTTMERRVRTGAAIQAPAVDWVGALPFALSIALALDTFVAVATALLFREALRGPAVSVGTMQGTALVLLVVTTPVLAVSMALVARGVTVALIGWLGALGSIAYQAVLFLFASPFNAFFFLYVAMLSLSFWSLVALAGRLPIERVAPRIGAHAPVRVVAAYLLINAALFLALWLQATVPAILSADPPAFLEGTGMTTGPVQIIDLGFTLPLMTLAAILLVRRRGWGYVLTGTLLVMLAIETASIGVDQWIGHAADPASPVASAALTPVFAGLTALGLVVLGLFLRRPQPLPPAPAAPSTG
jgi:hypothetical protein